MTKLRLLLVGGVLLLAFASASAQTGIGVRGLFGIDGNAYGGAELTYQKIGRSEFDLGWANDSWKLTGLKLFNLLSSGGYGIYAGVGGGLGYYKTHTYSEWYGTLAVDLGSYLMLGPIQLGLDWRPEWYVINHTGNNVGFNLALSARLVFGRR